MSFDFNLNPIIRRGVFDLGPYGVKFALADVDISRSKIAELHYYAKTPTNFLAANHCPSLLEPIVNTINEYKLNAEKQFSNGKSIEFFGIAREPFTDLKDSKRLLSEISHLTSTQISPLSIQDQKKLTRSSFFAVLGKKMEKSIIFNLTSHSTTIIDNGVFHEIEMTCRKFYDLVKRETRNRDSIYPLDIKDVKKLIQLALDIVRIDENLVEQIRFKVKSGFSVVGRGAIHNNVAQHYCNLYEFTKIITQTVDASFYSKSQLTEVIKLMSTRNLSSAIGLMQDINKYEQAEQELTNLILIYAIMSKAGITKVRTVNAKNIFGLLVQRA